MTFTGAAKERICVLTAIVLAVIATANPSAAQDADAGIADDFHRFTVGAFIGAGMATSTRQDPRGRRPRFAGNGGVYLGLHLSKVFAFEVGLGLIGKGDGAQIVGERYQIEVLELPIGVKWDIYGFQIGLAVALDVAVAGLSRVCEDSHHCDKIKWSDETYQYWDDYERFNFGPRVALGYAIPVGRAAIVPSVAWSMDILDNTRNAEDECVFGYCNGECRNINVMVNLGVEYGFDRWIRASTPPPPASPAAGTAPSR